MAFSYHPQLGSKPACALQQGCSTTHCLSQEECYHTNSSMHQRSHEHCVQVRVEDVEDSMYASIDLVCDKLRVKLRKMKEKLTDKRHERGRVHVSPCMQA